MEFFLLIPLIHCTTKAESITVILMWKFVYLSHQSIWNDCHMRCTLAYHLTDTAYCSGTTEEISLFMTYFYIV